MVTLKKLLVLLLVCVVLAGCATTDKVTLTTKSVPVAVPLIYSPAPPVIPRPDLPILTVPAADQKVDGKVAQAYAASVEALLGYSKQLEQALANYGDINTAYAGVRDKLVADWKANTGVDISIADPTIPVKPASSAPTPAAPVVPPVTDLVNHP